MRTHRLVVVGSINTDLVVSSEHLPVAGETVLGSGPVKHQGGKGANAAVAASRLGAAVSLVAAVGDDEFGRNAMSALQDEGVDTVAISTKRDVPTGSALIVVDPRGENLIAVGAGANGALTPDETERGLSALLGDRSGQRDDEDPIPVLIGLEIPDAVVATAIRVGKERGALVIVDPAPARRFLLELDLTGVLLTPNAGEARSLAGVSDERLAASRLCDITGAPVVVSLGAAGALLQMSSEASPLVVQAPAGVDVVDATGAGDTFAGALVSSLARGESLESSVRFAVAAGSCAVRAAGARTAMPTRDEVQSLVGPPETE